MLRVVASAVLCVVGFAAVPSGYEASVQQWRKQREERLRSKDGWLTVAGLFWLKPGENRAGSDPSYEIVLPESRAPKRLGVFDFSGGAVRFRIASGAHVTVNGKPVMTAELRPDTPGPADVLQSGDFTMFVIKRGDRYGIRLKDIRNPARLDFRGLHWYPIDPKYRIEANWIPYPKPQTIPIPNVLGQVEQMPSPGYAEFRISGKTMRLYPVSEGKELFFIFRDQTAAKTTYGAGRFLYADAPLGGKVVLDFNRAENPPCAFTPYATCPLPPKQNRLASPIPAGEQKYDDH